MSSCFQGAVGGGRRRSGSALIHTLEYIPRTSGSSLIAGRADMADVPPWAFADAAGPVAAVDPLVPAVERSASRRAFSQKRPDCWGCGRSRYKFIREG